MMTVAAPSVLSTPPNPEARDFECLLELAGEARQGIVSSIAELRFHLSRYDEPERIVSKLARALRQGH